MISAIVKKNLKALTSKIDQKLFGEKEFVIVSNNCWGAEIYKRLDKEYNTPFIGLFVVGPDYIKLLENFDHYMSQKLQFIDKSRWIDKLIVYPIGQLDDIEIHFVHYKDKEEAELKWTRRLSRMNKFTDRNKYFYKFCDRDFTTPDLINKFHTLPFENKISFGIRPINLNGHIVVAESENGTVLDGVFLYRNAFKYVDLFKWIKTGKMSLNWYGKIKSFAKIA